MNDPEPEGSPSVRAAILDRIVADRLRGLHPPVDAYEDLFPGYAHIAKAAYRDLDRSAADPIPSASPERIAGLRVVRKLGHGGQGSVFLARDEQLDRLVAVKVLSALHAVDQDRLERFRREAALVSRLEAPGICRLYSFGVENDRPFLVMEYVPGTSIAEIASGGGTEGSFELPTVLAWIEQVARSLQLAHDAGIVHRDVKPANLILSPQGRVVLLDFGLARSSGDDWTRITMSDTPIGTPAYMSPEQLRSDIGPVDQRTDVYSLAVTSYELLTGTRPFVGNTREELTDAIKLGRYEALRKVAPRLPLGVVRILAKAMDRDPARRYATAEQFAEDLARARENLPVIAKPLPLGVRAGRFVRDHPVATTALTCLVVALVISLTLLDIADRRLAENQQLIADQKLQALLQTKAPDLWRVHPSTIPAKNEWLQAADELSANLDSYRRVLDELRSRGRRVIGQGRPNDPMDAESLLMSSRSDRIALELAHHDRSRADLAVLQDLERQLSATSSASRGRDAVLWRFDDPTEQWRHDQLASLVETLEDINDPREAALTPNIVRRQLSRSATVSHDTVTNHRDAWRAFHDAVAADARLKSIDTTPRAGLVPLGPDPDSGLQEFALFASGAPPTRDPETRRLILNVDSAIVLVLLPGTRFLAGEAETVRHVSLAPFVIGKHEVTQAQWTRVMEFHHSVYQPGHAKVDITPSHPVENVTWLQAIEFARRLGMTLPSEAQWEYACLGQRAGRYAWDGDADDALRGRANIADLSLGNVDLPHADWNDDYPVTAPVGSFAANHAGLFDMHGNVCEWCTDLYEPKSVLAALEVAGDGSSITATDPRRVFKGGSWYLRPRHAHARIRHRLPANQGNSNLGVRVAAMWPPFQ